MVQHFNEESGIDIEYTNSEPSEDAVLAYRQESLMDSESLEQVTDCTAESIGSVLITTAEERELLDAMWLAKPVC